MEKRNYAVFIDLENTGGNVNTLKKVIEKVKIRGDILIGKVYGYQECFSGLKETLLSNTFNVLPSIRYGVNQKNNLDIQLVIDALEVAYTNPLIDCFCIVSERQRRNISGRCCFDPNLHVDGQIHVGFTGTGGERFQILLG
jgi:hypothetical protein